MKLEIPNFGTVEFDELPNDYCFDAIGDEHYNFAWIEKGDRKCIVCNPGISAALCEMLLEDDVFSGIVTDFSLPDMSYWFFVRNEAFSADATDLCISELFQVFLDNNIIQKIHSKELEEITDGYDYVYVFPDHDKFSLEDNIELRKQLGNAALNTMPALLDERIERCEDGYYFVEEEYQELVDEVKKNYANAVNEIKEALENLNKQ